MKPVLAVAAFSVLLCGVSAAQSAEGYAFFAPGAFTCCGGSAFAMNFGFGAKGAIKGGLGVGGELGAVASKDYFTSSIFGLASANGYYDFGPREAKFRPFVTGGYSRSFGHGMDANWGNFGGGANYWFAEKAALLVEFRDHLNCSYNRTYQMWGVRLGVSFR